MMNIEYFILLLVALSFVALIFGLILRYFRQPSVVAYILTGMVAGPSVLGIVGDSDIISQVGSLGVIMLLFFVGMQINLKRLVSNWKIALAGTSFQVFVSILFVAAAAFFLEWPFPMVILFGFVISLSSTAVVLKILESKNKTNSKLGRDAISIILVQDLAVIPMIIIITYLSGTAVSGSEVLFQIVGFMFMIGFVLWMMGKRSINIPFRDKIVQDPEFQLLGAFAICFGFALVSGFFHLSAALGSFIAGLFVRSAKQTGWVTESLRPFKTIFLALFFVYIGLLIRVDFVMENLPVILILVFSVFITNTFINAAIFKFLGETWKYGMYAGSLLAQIGEFSFILVVVGVDSTLIDHATYEIAVTVIAFSLILSPVWMAMFSTFSKKVSKSISRLSSRAKKKA